MSITYHMFLEQFGETEWLTPTELLRYQERRLARLIRHAEQSVEGYRDHLTGVALDDEQIDWRRWRDLPTVHASALAEQGHSFLSFDVPTDHGDVHYEVSTDLSEPVGVAWSEYNTLTEECLAIRLCAWHDIDPTQTLAVLVQSPAEDSEPDQPFWGPQFKATGISGRRKEIDTSHPDPDWLAELVSLQPAVIQGSPDDIARLCELARASGISLRPAQIIVSGAPMPDKLARRCRRVLGVSPISLFRAPEVGTLAIQCPQTAVQHTMGDNFFIEILDELDQPVAVGKAGRLVVTPLFNYAMPLLRYDTGDIAAPGTACACGRCFPTLERIVGRASISDDPGDSP
jgi:phenylacetate-CoA ligase